MLLSFSLSLCTTLGSVLITMPRTPVNDRLVAVGMMRAGMSYSHVARQYGVDRHMVARWHLRQQQNNNVTFLGQGARESRLRSKIVSSGSSTLGTGSNQLPSLLKPSLDYGQSAHVSSVTVYGSTGYNPGGLLDVLF